MRKLILQNLTFFFLIIFGFKGYSAVCTATLSGSWENPAVWSCGHVPLCTDNITIPSGYTVTITTILDYNTAPCATQTMVVSISGVLKFQTGKKLTLPPASIVLVAPGASIQPGGGGGTSNLLTIGTVDVWRAGDGPIAGPAIVTSGGLPIELTYFNGALENKSVKLQWQTATESSNDYFEIQRSSDGVTFEKLNQIDSKSLDGNSLQTLNYEITDLNPKKGINYYRLKQVDFSTESSYSRIVSVDFNKVGDFSFNVFPNPNDGHTFDISMEGIESGDAVSIIVYDITGHESYSKALKINESDNLNHSINLENKLASGIYMISASKGTSTFSKRLIVR